MPGIRQGPDGDNTLQGLEKVTLTVHTHKAHSRAMPDLPLQRSSILSTRRRRREGTHERQQSGQRTPARWPRGIGTRTRTSVATRARGTRTRTSVATRRARTSTRLAAACGTRAGARRPGLAGTCGSGSSSRLAATTGRPTLAATSRRPTGTTVGSPRSATARPAALGTPRPAPGTTRIRPPAARLGWLPTTGPAQVEAPNDPFRDYRRGGGRPDRRLGLARHPELTVHADGSPTAADINRHQCAATTAGN